VREDGLSIDQIVLSPASYLNTAPGALKDDTTILGKSGGSTAPPPSITSVSPDSGPDAGGTSVTVNGSGFAAGATLTFGGTSAANIAVVNSTTITAVTPPRAAGPVDVIVRNPDNQTGVLNSGFTYTGGGGGETVILEDDFGDNSLDTAKWTGGNLFSGFTDSNLPVNEASQRIEVGPLLQGASGSHYNGIRSASPHGFNGSYSYVELAQPAATNTAGDAMFTLGKDVNNYYRIYVESGILICQKRIGGAKTNLLSTAYSPSSHRYIRISHDASAGSVVFASAPDNGGTPGSWMELVREPWNTASVPLGSVLFELKGGTWQPEANAAGTVIFDNFRAATP
jgi:hypothetical protein